MPVLPFYAKEFGASATTLGFLLMVYAAGQFLFAPLWGRLSDRIGRRGVLLFTVAGTAASLLLLGLASSLVALFVARALAGAFAANISVASAYIADVTDESERTRWMGMLGASFGIGFLLGPAIGGGLAPYGYSVPMLVTAALATVNLVFAAVFLREPERHAGAGGPGPTRRELLANPRIRRLCVANLAFALSVTQLETIFPFFMADRFGYDAREVGFFFAGIAFVMVLIQGGGIRALAARYPERSLVIGGSLLLAIGFFFLPISATVGWLLLPILASAAGRAVVQPSLMSLVSMAATREARGAVMGTFQASASLARIVGPVAAGLLYDVTSSGPFYLAAGLLTVVALLGRGLDAGATAEPAPAA